MVAEVNFVVDDEDGKKPEVQYVKNAGERKKALDLPVLIFRGSSHLMEGSLLVVARVSFFQVALTGRFSTSGILIQYHDPRRPGNRVADYYYEEQECSSLVDQSVQAQTLSGSHCVLHLPSYKPRSTMFIRSYVPTLLKTEILHRRYTVNKRSSMHNLAFLARNKRHDALKLDRTTLLTSPELQSYHLSRL